MTRSTIPMAALALCAPAWLVSAAWTQTATKVTVTITSPQNGDTVAGPVRVIMRATGVQITPTTVERAGTAHHHLFVDHDLTWLSDTIPMGSPGILHLSDGKTEYVLEGLAPGRHRVIAMLADWRHVPLNPIVADTVTFVVK